MVKSFGGDRRAPKGEEPTAEQALPAAPATASEGPNEMRLTVVLDEPSLERLGARLTVVVAKAVREGFEMATGAPLVEIVHQVHLNDSAEVKRLLEEVDAQPGPSRSVV